jgi:phage terminase large subunit
MSQPFCDTLATQRIFKLKKRIRAVAGGTSASKTISILIWLIDRGQSGENEVMTVVAESVPHLKLGAIRDFKSIMQNNGYWDDSKWNASNFTYSFKNGSILEFISFDKFGKAHGPRRDILFVNEANNLEYDIVDQLITRTKKIIWLDWNPTSEFWFYTDMLNNRDDIDFITLTYKDCLNALDQSIIDEIESHKNNKNWWQVYGLGQLGEIEGRIYKNWALIDEIPKEARLERYGLDFGYSNDPTAIVAIYYYNGGWIFDERCYKKGMSNKDIVDTIKQMDDKMVVADSAEPKSIDEIKSYGINIQPCKKGRDSVRQGIQLVQDQPISVTKRSVNLIKEYRNYLWATDKNGKFIKPNEPCKGWDHLLDAIRYGMETLGRIKQEQPYWDRVWELDRQGIKINKNNFNKGK